MRTISSIRLVGFVLIVLSVLVAGFAAAVLAAGPDAADSAKTIIDKTGVAGGLVVHVGCGDGKLTAALRAGDNFRVHGLDRDAKKVEQARRYIQEQGLYGPVSVDRLTGERLPYIDDLVNLLVVEGGAGLDGYGLDGAGLDGAGLDGAGLDGAGLDGGELMRVLAPRGVAYVRRGGKWTKLVKPWPQEIDEWTHF
ncbi:MAG: class I SAM-dependent methyltransferase, partial [Planctomycetota bacterium]|nr:class I SAM-dependent methyltransferase [Planctomycetota bacterium]